jgi:hypothetical protein
MMQALATDSGASNLTAYLAELFALEQPERIRHAESFRRRFIDTVVSVLESPQWETARRGWASQSYRHENGFIKLIAFATPCDAFRLRVHVWPHTSECDVERLNVHNHRYSFISYVARGEIDDYCWLPIGSGAEFNRFVYRPRDDSGCYSHEHTGSATLAIDRIRRYSRGHLYSLDSSELHCTAPAGSTRPVTFFVEDRRALRAHAISYSRHQLADEERIYTPAVSMEQYLQLLNTYVVATLD